jgi:hypothetical protein
VRKAAAIRIEDSSYILNDALASVRIWKARDRCQWVYC